MSFQFLVYAKSLVTQRCCSSVEWERGKIWHHITLFATSASMDLDISVTHLSTKSMKLHVWIETSLNC